MRNSRTAGFGILLLLVIYGCAGDSSAKRKTGVPKKPAPLARKLNPDHAAVLKAHGDVTEMAELHDVFARKEPDSTPLYAKAEKKVNARLISDLASLSRWDPKTSPEEAKGLMERRQDVLSLLDEAVEMERPSWPRNWSDGYGSDMRQTEAMSKFGQLMAVRARYKASQKDLDGALSDYKKLDKLIQHMLAYHDSAGLAAAEMLEQRDFLYLLIAQNKDNKEALEKIRETVENRPPMISYQHTMFAAAADCIHAMEDDRRFAQLSGGEAQARMSGGRAVREQAGDECLMRAAEIYRAADEMKGTDDYSRVMEMLYLHELELNYGGSPVSRLVRQAMYTEMIENMQIFKYLTRRRQQVVAARLAEERLRLGRWPDKLPDWGEITRDPFSQLPFAYKKTQKGILLYSYGPDRMDDGGQPLNENNNGDMIVRFNFD